MSDLFMSLPLYQQVNMVNQRITEMRKSNIKEFYMKLHNLESPVQDTFGNLKNEGKDIVKTLETLVDNFAKAISYLTEIPIDDPPNIKVSSQHQYFEYRKQIQIIKYSYDKIMLSLDDLSDYFIYLKSKDIIELIKQEKYLVKADLEFRKRYYTAAGANRLRTVNAVVTEPVIQASADDVNNKSLDVVNRIRETIITISRE